MGVYMYLVLAVALNIEPTLTFRIRISQGGTNNGPRDLAKITQGRRRT